MHLYRAAFITAHFFATCSSMPSMHHAHSLFLPQYMGLLAETIVGPLDMESVTCSFDELMSAMLLVLCDVMENGSLISGLL